MTTPIFSPLGLSLRDSLLLATIVSSMALSACMSARERKQTEEQVERTEAASATLERQEQQGKQEQEKQAKIMAAREAALKEWLTKWVQDNEPYVRSLCGTDPGIEHQWTWDNFKVAVSTDTQHASEAKGAGRPVIDCEALRLPKPAEFNPTAFLEAVTAETTKRTEWLASPVGKEYQRHLCSLSGAHRQAALLYALNEFGILPPENVSDEPLARKHGFTMLDCAKLTTSALGYTWSNAAEDSRHV